MGKVLSPEERQRCWDARDAFHACLDVNNNVEAKCADLRVIFKRDCPEQWMKHFDQGRIQRIRMERMQQLADAQAKRS